MGDLGSIPGLGRSPGEAKGYPLQHSGLENSMDYSPWGRKESDMTFTSVQQWREGEAAELDRGRSGTESPNKSSVNPGGGGLRSK